MIIFHLPTTTYAIIAAVINALVILINVYIQNALQKCREEHKDISTFVYALMVFHTVLFVLIILDLIAMIVSLNI